MALYAHTPRVSGNGAGFPLFKEAPEGEWADDGAPPAVDRSTLFGFNIGLKHQLLTWLTMRSEKRIKRTHTLVLCGNNRTVESGGKHWEVLVKLVINVSFCPKSVSYADRCSFFLIQEKIEVDFCHKRTYYTTVIIVAVCFKHFWDKSHYSWTFL